MQKLTITDRIFGRHTITSPVLIDLINSNPVQRLKGIGQAGQPVVTDPRPFRCTRYDHSIGVMLLLKRLHATEEEQIAGLLHDVSHTAFSHTIDFVLGRGKAEDFQDSNHEHFIVRSVIPKILKKYNYSVERIYNYHHFTLLEQDLPNLCADRIDYSLREVETSVTKAVLPHLHVVDGKIVFTDKKAAKLFAMTFLFLQNNHWGGKEHVIRERFFAYALRQAIEENILTLDDFWQDDAFVLNKIQHTKSVRIQHFLAAVRRKSYLRLPESKSVIHKKFRFVDPVIFLNDNLTKLSEIDNRYRETLKKARHKNEDGIVLPVL